jgi:hypothetical protein
MGPFRIGLPQNKPHSHRYPSSAADTTFGNELADASRMNFGARTNDHDELELDRGSRDGLIGFSAS